MPSPRVTVVIPTLDEEHTIATAVESCRREGAAEIIVSDGGSSDRTLAIADSLGVLLVVSDAANRARQMNAGARLATGDLLVFLHADSAFRPGAFAALLREVDEFRAIGGGFQRRYISSSILLNISCHIGNARARHIGWVFGDQAIWVRRDVFNRLGGFPESATFEDLDFSRRLRAAGPLALVSPGVETSARRFRHGVASRLVKDFMLTVRHVCRDPAP